MFGAVTVDAVISVPLPWCSDPDDVRRHSRKEEKLHNTFFQDDMFLFYVIGIGLRFHLRNPTGKAIRRVRHV